MPRFYVLKPNKIDKTEEVGQSLLQDNLENNMNIITRVFKWIVWSSQNPDKISLTLKGLVSFIAFFDVAHSNLLNQSSPAVVELVVQLGAVLTGAITLFGAGRKLYNTFIKK